MPARPKEKPKGLKSKEFRRMVEDFECFNCKRAIHGSGYTDHCPNCLWGMHVDVMPGDRASQCKGAMKPKYAVSDRSNYVLVYECQRCLASKSVTAAPEDNIDLIFSLAKNAMLTGPRT